MSPRFFAASAACFAVVLPALQARAQTTDPAPAPAPPTDTTTTLPPATSSDTTTATPPPAYAAPTQPAPARKRDRLRFGPQVGVYLPASNKAKDSFGDSWFNYGIGIGNVQRTRQSGQIGFDANVITGARGGGARAVLVPIGVTYRASLGSDTRATVPYYGASLNYVVTSLRDDRRGIVSRTRGAGGGSIFVGTRFSESGTFEVRYLFISRVRGYDLSGLNLTAGLRF